MKLLIITQKVDEQDDLLGFFVSWIAEFAKHFNEVHVIALSVGAHSLPENVRVYSLNKDRGVSKLGQGLAMTKLLWRLTKDCDSVFAHMSPIFAIAAWPFTVLRGDKLVLWYLHRSDTLRLRLALLLADHLVTADRDSLTVRSSKIIPVGHGVEVAKFFTPRDWVSWKQRPLRIISVGRLSPIKDFKTLIEALVLLRKRGISAELRIVGRAVMPGDLSYEKELKRLVSAHNLNEAVTFVGFVPHANISEQYHWTDVAVGCTPSGGIDKTLLESMAAGCIVLTSNTVMKNHLGPQAERLLFNHGDATDLMDRVGWIASTSSQEVASLSQRLVGIARDQFSVARVIAAITKLL